MKKILKTTLIIALGLIIGGVSYTFTQKDKSLLLGDLTIVTSETNSKYIASDGAADDYFGFAVAVDGNYAVVGAYGANSNEGAAYVFKYNGLTWTEIAILTANVGATGDYFGYSVAIDGDTVVVGAYLADGGGTDEGSAYIFEKPGTGWITTSTETAKLTASDGATNDEFGYSVAIDGDNVVVGAYLADGGGTDEGSAYIFEKPGTGWITTSTETAKLTASDGATNDKFGFSVAIDGDTIVAGAVGDDTDTGAAYVFKYNGSTWPQITKLIASDGVTNDAFGFSVTINDSTIVVGAVGDDTDTGAAYVFKYNGSTWPQITKLIASDGATSDAFGISVAISNDTVAVGAHGDDDNGSLSGSAYVFEKPTTGWNFITNSAKLTASDGATNDFFGISVAISDSAVIVGAYGDDDNGSLSGSFYSFDSSEYADYIDDDLVGTCSDLQMLILRGQGSGAYTGTEILPTPAYSDYFDFNSSVYATGSVTVTAGDSTGSADTYLVTIGTDPGTAVDFNTDLNTTATDIATDITNDITGYTATAVANVVNITADSSGVDTKSVSILPTDGTGGVGNVVPTATSSGMSGGGVPIETIVISNPIAAETGQQTFAITFNFVDTLTEERAVITSSIGDGTYGISVKDEGTDTVATSENFIYAVNDLLGIASPFIAVLVPGGRVQLISKELGTHTNDYTCMINNAYFPVSGLTIGNCFSGAIAGDVDVLTQPLTMDNTMTQGDTALIYIAGGTGVTEWGTSHPSVLEVVPFGEIGEGGGGGTVQFIPEAFVGTEDIDKTNGTYNIDCETEYDTSDPVNIVSQECTVDFVIPVEYDSQDDFETIVYLGDEEVIVPVTLETGKLTGTIVGTGTYNYNTGLSVQLEGQVVGTVRGNAVGDASGIVSGNIYSDISVGVSVDYGNDLLTVNFPLKVTPSPTSASTISAEGDFISTVELADDDPGITNYAVLYAKRAGTSILTVTDELTCVAALEVEVLRKRVILDMVGKDPSDVFEVGESVQINAYLGSADAELDENENITYAQGIEWISSNPDVATIDASGVLSIVAPGIVNIMATYYVGDAEIDPVQSDPMTIKVSKITGLTIALDEAAQAVMSNAELNEAYESVLIILNDPKSAGRTITVEGEAFDIELPTGTYNNDSERIAAIIAKLESDISGMFSSPAPTVSYVVGLPGILILQPNTLDVNGYIDISSTATKEDLTIFPNFSNGISLPASETFGLMVIADYDNGRTKRLNTTDVTWINTPLNYLEQTALEAGLMKMGGITGTSTVIATYENADGTIINSNQLVVNVESGPEIEYARRIQSGSITQGSRITLRTKVTDVDTIADISEITTSIVRSEFNTYHSINSDPSAVWFTAETFENEVTVESESAPIVTEGEEGEEEEEEVETTTVILNYKTYSIPIEIPVDEYLYDGNYNLILSISDASNHTSNFVLPIYIGEQASGDVSGDGVIGMVDVILAFQIASDPSGFTQQQLEAADMDHMGGVTMIDVILLFNRATSN